MSCDFFTLRMQSNQQDYEVHLESFMEVTAVMGQQYKSPR